MQAAARQTTRVFEGFPQSLAGAASDQKAGADLHFSGVLHELLV
jgi:hypothetical protein